jgi:hypothetical protein
MTDPQAYQLALSELREELQTANRAVEEGREALEVVQARIAAAQSEATNLRQLIEWLEARSLGKPAEGQTTLTPAAETTQVPRPPAGPPRPTTSDAILRVLADASAPMTVPEITDEIRNRGWASTRSTNFQASVRQAVLRLYRVNQKVDRPTTGHYRLASSTNGPEPPSEQPPTVAQESFVPPEPDRP